MVMSTGIRNGVHCGSANGGSAWDPGALRRRMMFGSGAPACGQAAVAGRVV